MKRNIANLVSLIVLGATSLISACSGEQLDAPIVEEMVDGSHWERANINLHVNRIEFDAQDGTTRSVDEGWNDGDRIYLILKDKDGNNVQAYVEYDTVTTAWGQVEYNAYKYELTCTAPRTVEAYYFDGEMNVTTTDITFEATTGVYACKDGIYIYPSDGDLEVSISLVPLTSRIRFTGESGTNFSLSGITTHTAFSRTTGALTTTSSNVSTSVDDTGTTPYLYGVFTNPERPTLGVVNSSKDMFVTEFEASTHVLQVGHSGYMSIPTEDSHRGWKQVGTNGHEYVDLGLTSGTLWATMNVGASSPSDYGDYFAWGEVSGYKNGKSSFSWSTYKYCNGTYDSITKYCTTDFHGNVDNKTELELSDDAACHNWGGSWRMPSKAQFEELYDECTWTWTTLNGYYGYWVSSKKNSNSLFLPAAGYRTSSAYDTGSYGHYWSRSIDESNSCVAHTLYFSSNSINPSWSYSNHRCCGMSIRPVLGSE